MFGCFHEEGKNDYKTRDNHLEFSLQLLSVEEEKWRRS